MEDLITIFDGLNKVTDEDGKQFSKIFFNDDIFNKFNLSFKTALRKAMVYEKELSTSERMESLKDNLMREGIEFDWDKIISSDYRNELRKKLIEVKSKRIFKNLEKEL